MNVLYALDSVNRGGAETHVLDVCRNAGKHGIDMTFVSFGGGTYDEEFQNGDFESLRIDRRLPLDPFLVQKLRKILKDKNIDVAHGFQAVEAVHLYLACLGTGTKCVQTHQGFISGTKNKITAKLISGLVNANITVSEGLLPWLRDEIGIDTSTNFFLVHNTVDSKRLEPSPNSIRTELGIPKSMMLGGMVANFLARPTKDQMTVCKALPRVFSESEDAGFVFVGNVAPEARPYFDECVAFCEEEGIADRVYFTGARNDVPDILNTLDLFVLSSLVEGMPVSVIEAMMAGLPVIVSNIPPLLEVTDMGRCAEVFETGNAAELGEKMTGLLEESKRREELANRGREFANSQFGIEAHFKALKAVYEQIIDR